MTAQRKGILLTLATTIGIIVAVVSLFVYTMTQPRILSVKELVNNGAILYEHPLDLQPFALVDHNGKPFTDKDLAGQWTLMFFGFSHCGGFCPTTLALLNQFVQQLEPDIAANTQVIMVSVDPARDTPARLKDYMTTFNPEFVGLTGNNDAITALSKQFYIAVQQPNDQAVSSEDGYNVAHGEQIVLVNPEGQYHGFFKPPFALARLKTTYQSMILTYRH